MSKIENGKRPVDLDDVAALARALVVPPIVLIFPLGAEPLSEVLPGLELGTWTATKWFSGLEPFPNLGPIGRWAVEPAEFDAWRDGAVALFHDLDAFVDTFNRANTRAGVARHHAALAAHDGDDASARTHGSAADEYERDAERAKVQVARHRALMRRIGFDPGEFGGTLSDVDDIEVEP